MTAITRRMLASVAVAAAVATPVIGGITVAGADAIKLPSGVTVNVPSGSSSSPTKDDDHDKDDKASVDAAQKILTSIQDAKNAEALEGELDKDIKGLADNESAIPAKVKDEYKKFESELKDAKSNNSLDGDKSSDTFKKIQSDAKTLSSDLKSAS
ncbi:MAG: hypothetical protein J2P18_00100 [Nocardia sp.]|nr:hypothetical protein [Nocardia sp.]